MAPLPGGQRGGRWTGSRQLLDPVLVSQGSVTAGDMANATTAGVAQGTRRHGGDVTDRGGGHDHAEGAEIPSAPPSPDGTGAEQRTSVRPMVVHEARMRRPPGVPGVHRQRLDDTDNDPSAFLTP
jgi:hypothetical protein